MTRVAVAGLGLIGGSIALALKARGYDRDPFVREKARSRGIDVADSLAEAVAAADVAIIAISTSDTPALLVALAAAAPRAILTDTASIKRPVVEAARSLRAEARFVAGHPMAGSQRSGIDAASAELFRGRPWILCRTARSDAEAVERVSEVVSQTGARPVLLEARDHDRAMTWASHLPLAVASALARAAARGGGAELPGVAGPGLLDSTRVAAQPPALALELALASPGDLADAVEEVRGELAKLSGALRLGDAEAVRAFLEEASELRGRLTQLT